MPEEPYEPLLGIFLTQQKRLDEFINKIINQFINAYGAVYRDLTPYINNIRLIIENDPKITVAQIKKTAEYTALLEAVEREVDDFSTYATVELRAQSHVALELAILGLGAFYSAVNVEQANIVPPDAMDFLLDYLNPDGALMGRIGMWAGNAADMVSKSIIDGVALGRNPRAIARDITESLGVGLKDAMRTTTTVQMYSYREATRMNWLANSDVVKGWIWYSALIPGVSCMSCVGLHGTIHPLTESMNDHYRGKCTMLPIVGNLQSIYDYPDPNNKGHNVIGKEWFETLSKEMQTKMMGVGKYDAWQNGLIDIDERLSKEYNDPVYGTMRSETPLKDLINEQ